VGAVSHQRSGPRAEREDPSARSLIGQVIEGRYLLRRKTGHTRTTVRFAAHDLVGGLEVELAVNPDGTVEDGFRVRDRELAGAVTDLPELCRLTRDLTGLTRAPPPRPGFLAELWRGLRALFRRRAPVGS